jgi:hypothetical protein
MRGDGRIYPRRRSPFLRCDLKPSFASRRTSKGRGPARRHRESRRAGYPIRVLGRSGDGVPQSWEVKLVWAGRKQSWLRLVSLALSQWQAAARASAPELARAKGRVGLGA